MKTKKLLRHFNRFLDAAGHRRHEERKALKKLLTQLRQKRADLETELQGADNPEAAADLQKKITLIAAQVEKGEQMLLEKQPE